MESEEFGTLQKFNYHHRVIIKHEKHLAIMGNNVTVSPLDYRYGREEAKSIWSREGRHERQLDVERALIWAHCQLGRVSPEDYDKVAEIAKPEIVTADRVDEIERETRHDIMALTKAMAEAAGDSGWCIHLGATSNDIVDSAVALQIRDSINLQQETLKMLLSTLCDLAERERDTVMLGRTHGQAAVPITFGLKVAVWVDEFRRHLDRLDELTPRVTTGKFLGAVGTGAAQGENAFELQNLIMQNLGLQTPIATTQVVGRDRYIEWVSWMANVSTSIEKALQEVRNLQRSEIAEVGEYFDAEKQVGSSTMAHKKNPITAENACGLARIVRSMIIPSYENALLWHERDLSNSANERFTIPMASILLDEMIETMIRIISNLKINDKRVRENLYITKGQIFAEFVLEALIKKGIPRFVAYRDVQRVAFEAHEKKMNYMDALIGDKNILKSLTEKEIRYFCT